MVVTKISGFFTDTPAFFAIVAHDSEILETFDNRNDAEIHYSQWQYDYCHPEDAEIVQISELEYANEIDW